MISWRFYYTLLLRCIGVASCMSEPQHLRMEGFAFGIQELA